MAMDRAARTEQYKAEPMLRLLDAWVLDAVGVLDEQTSARLAAMAPKIAQTFGVTAPTWQQAVEATMHFPPTLAADVRTSWETNERRFEAEDQRADPIDFAHAFVDTNLR